MTSHFASIAWSKRWPTERNSEGISHKAKGYHKTDLGIQLFADDVGEKAIFPEAVLQIVRETTIALDAAGHANEGSTGIKTQSDFNAQHSALFNNFKTGG